jgi:Kef-type K+ transport system membrane component KefB
MRRCNGENPLQRPLRFPAMPFHSLATTMVAVGLISVVAQLIGSLAERCRQPRVMGEIIGGILLGPSLLGAIAPGLEQHLFTTEVRDQINLLGQLGLVLFMFLVGLELNPRRLQGRIPLASRITSVGLVLPLILGIALAALFERWQPELLPGHNQPAAALFMGTAMGITAFPVLARILRERQLTDQPVGALAITAAAIGDALGWILLAVVVALARSGSLLQALSPLLGITIWAVILLAGLRPLRRQLERSYRRDHQLSPLLQSLLFSGALVSAAVTEVLGVHLIFGAFLWGLAMPRYAPLLRRLERRLEAVVLQLLLPLFFAISGLNTRLGSLNEPQLWLATAALVLVAIAGKYGGTWATARFSGVDDKEAQALGWLMNTRGLTELVILNVGLSLGVISDALFSMGVLMALATTLMAGPLLDRLGYGRRPGSRQALAHRL